MTPEKFLKPDAGFPEQVETWDDYFQWMAEAVAIKSKDPKCRVGAVIVSQDNIVLSTGFNGLARRLYDDERLLENADEKIKIICHAEANAILNAARIGVALAGASIFVNKFPCLACCNAIVQAGIIRIHTHDDHFWDQDPLDSDHSRKIAVLRQARIRVDAPFHPEFVPHGPINRKRGTPVGARKVPSRSTVVGLPVEGRDRKQPDLFKGER